MFIQNLLVYKVSKPQNWKILPHDFFIGIVPIDDDHRKIILRLKGSLENNELNYVLETVSIGKELNLSIDDEYLSEYLTETHDIVVNYFIEFLTDELHKSIGTEFR